jgi:hypothetical protein
VSFTGATLVVVVLDVVVVAVSSVDAGSSAASCVSLSSAPPSSARISSAPSPAAVPTVVSDAVVSAVGTTFVEVGAWEVAGFEEVDATGSPNPAGTTIRTAWSAERTTTVLTPWGVVAAEEQADRAATRHTAVNDR